MISSIGEQINAVPFWWHSIPIGDHVTPGQVSLERQRELTDLWPDMRGKSVLDIGAWDGYFSFEAERRGASRVVALDHHAWERDMAGSMRLWRESGERGVVPPLEEYDRRFHRPEELPGKLAFDTAHRLLGSRVIPVVADFMEMDLEALGQFDVVLYQGVLYHQENAMGAVRRLHRVTRGVAFVETAAAEFAGVSVPACEFYPGAELNRDWTSWWAPNAAALRGMLLAAGFMAVEILTPAAPPRRPTRLVQKARACAGFALREFGLKQPLPREEPRRYRLTALAYRNDST